MCPTVATVCWCQVPVAVVGASSNRACATCPTVAKVHDVRVPVADVGASSNHACATCPTVATGETRLLLLWHHNSDGTTAVGHLPVTTEGYGPLIQRHIVVVGAGLKQLIASSVGSWPSGFLCHEGLWPRSRAREAWHLLHHLRVAVQLCLHRLGWCSFHVGDVLASGANAVTNKVLNEDRIWKMHTFTIGIRQIYDG
jgi:hypothetical protein